MNQVQQIEVATRLYEEVAAAQKLASEARTAAWRAHCAAEKAKELAYQALRAAKHPEEFWTIEEAP